MKCAWCDSDAVGAYKISRDDPETPFCPDHEQFADLPAPSDDGSPGYAMLARWGVHQ